MVSSIMEEGMIQEARWGLADFYASKGLKMPGSGEKHPWEPLAPQMPKTQYPHADVKKPPIGTDLALWPPESQKTRANITGSWKQGSINGKVLTWKCGTQTPLTSVGPSNVKMILHGRPFTAELRNGDLHWSDGDVWTCKDNKLKSSSSTSSLPAVHGPTRPNELTRRLMHGRKQNGGMFSDAPAWLQGVY